MVGNYNRRGDSVVGLDCSTKTLAFCQMKKGVPTHWGEINLTGSTAFERIHDAKAKMASLGLKADVVAIESAIYVNNMRASISLAYVYGAVLGELMTNNTNVYAIEPLKWQAHIGNKLWTAKEKAALQAANPGKAKTWYKQEVYRRRKQYTIDWVEKAYGIKLDSDNVADSFGLAAFVTDTYNE